MRNIDQYKGVWVETITPMGFEGKILKPTILKHYDFLDRNSVQGIVPLSPTGEGPLLSYEEKIQVLRKYGEAGIKMKIMPAVLENSLKTACYLIKDAISSSVDGFVFYPPYFYDFISQNSLFSYYDKLLSVIEEHDCELPVFITANDPFTKIPLSNITLEKLCKKYDNIYGVFEFFTKNEQVQVIKNKIPNIIIISSHESDYLSFADSGADGVLSILGNIFPQSINSLYNIKRKQLKSSDNMGFTKDKLLLLQEKIKMCNQIFNKYPLQAGLKYALYQQQFPAMCPRIPLESLKESQKTVLKNEIKAIMGDLSKSH